MTIKTRYYKLLRLESLEFDSGMLLTAPMKNRRNRRVFYAILLSTGVVVVQLAGFCAIAWNVWRDVETLRNPCTTVPFTPVAKIFRGEIVYPMLTIGIGGMNTGGNVAALRAVHLGTGRVRQIPVRNLDFKRTMLTDGERLWMFGSQTICEFDGTTVVEHSPRRLIGPNANSSYTFLYEGRPALIDSDVNHRNWLLVLVNGEWEERGEIALPGDHRAWATDQTSGREILVPRTSANPTNEGMSFFGVGVTHWRGKYFIFRAAHQHVHNQIVCCFRDGFDFVVRNRPDGTGSALAPENAPADSTCWTLTEPVPESAASYYDAAIGPDNDLYFVDEGKIRRATTFDGLVSPSQSEQVGSLELAMDADHNIFSLSVDNLLSSPGDQAVYAISGNMFLDYDVYRLVDGQWSRLPYHVEGIIEPVKRWLARILWQSVAVLFASTVLLILLSAWMTAGASYSFGTQTVLLAPIIRRSLARCFDLTLIFGPLILQLLWILWRLDGPRMEAVVEQYNDQTIWHDFYPAVSWICVVWACTVVSTGLWGLTPGKWLLGLRVVRTTLRPCGIFPALLRELLVCLDAPQFVTALPGLVCCFVTHRRQRIGDLAAGTLVIRNR